MGSIRQRAGGADGFELPGTTVAGAVAALEQACPPLRGWVVDEQGALRRHVKIFLRQGAVALDTPVEAGDELFIVGAISGG